MKEYIVRCEQKIIVEGEMVRCKDCKWFDVNRANFVEGYGYCEIYEVTNKDSHYCSYGEKQVTGKLNNPDDSLLTEKSEVVDTYIAGVVWGYNRGVKDCERGLQLSPETSTTSKTETEDTDLISRQAIKYHTQLEAMGNGQYEEVEVAYKSDIDSLPPVDPPKKVVAEITINTDELMKRIKEEYEITERPKGVFLAGMDMPESCGKCHFCHTEGFREWCCISGREDILYDARPDWCQLESLPPVEPKRPRGEWVSCSEPPKDRRNVFLAHGTNDFKSCCIGHYEQGMGWYEDRNFFAKPIYDCKYWCDIPELPDLGNNQFGTEVSADMRGDKE